MRRMIDDYYNKYYNVLFERSSMMLANDYEKARQLAAWKRRILRGWDSVEVVSVSMPDSTKRPLRLGENFVAEIVLNVNELSPNDLGLEVLFGQKVNDEVKTIIDLEEMTLAGVDGNIVTYFIEIRTEQAGVYDFAFRLFPKHPLLPHRQDFNLVRWISNED